MQVFICQKFISSPRDMLVDILNHSLPSIVIFVLTVLTTAVTIIIAFIVFEIIITSFIS